MLSLYHFTSHFLRIMWALRAVFIIMMMCLVMGTAAIAHSEKIPVQDAFYFCCITGLTIGYGDIVMKTAAERLIAILLGFIGVLFTGLVVAAAVESVRKSLQMPRPHD